MIGIGIRRLRNVSVNAGLLSITVVFFLGYIVFCDCTNINTRPFGGFLLWVSKGLLGSALTAIIVKGLPDRGFKWLEWIGGMSMGIMLIHKFPMVAIQEHISVVRSLFGGDLFLALTGCIFVFIASVGCSIVGVIVLKKFFPMSVGERKCIG